MAGALRIAAGLLSLIVILGFLNFVTDEAKRGSDVQVQKVTETTATPAPAPANERERERMQGSVGEAIDDANDVLLSPFSRLSDSHDPWVRRVLPTVLGLLVYGFLPALVANALPRRRRGSADWRTAT